MFKLVGGELYKYRPSKIVDETIGDEDAWKLVVPKEKQAQILSECHDMPTAGHLGRDKTLSRIAKMYYW